MDLVGAWLRQLFRAGTAAAVVPVALLAALLVVALGSGGVGGLGSLGQLVAGPAVPNADAGRSPMADVRAAPVAPGARDVAPKRLATATRAGAGAPAPAPVTRAPVQGSTRLITPVSPASTTKIAPARPTPPATITPVAPPPAAAGPKPAPQLGEVIGSTVNSVVVGVQTFIGRLAQALGLAPPH